MGCTFISKPSHNHILTGKSYKIQYVHLSHQQDKSFKLTSIMFILIIFLIKEGCTGALKIPFIHISNTKFRSISDQICATDFNISIF